MRIRPAEPADVPVVHDIVQRAYAIYVERIGRRPGPMDDDYAAKVGDGRVFVAEDADAGIAGLIVLVDHPDHVLIENLAVDPRRQGAGVGRLLLAHAERHALARATPVLRLYTHQRMTENRALYGRLGYREDESRGRLVFLSKRLDGAVPADG